MSVLIAISAITSMGFASDANAASASSSRITVCSRNMSHNGCRIDRSTTVNIPASGKYTVSGSVGRGTHNRECQAHEDFDLYIDGRFYASNVDDNSCESGTSNVYRNHGFPSITLSRGSHTIRMIHRWWNKPSTGSAESVSVALTFAAKVAPTPPKPTPVNGSCGNSNGKTVDTVPTSGLCSVGTASSVNGSGPWNWTCSGSKGGSDASCSATITAAPVCGSANSGTFSGTPTSGLCSVGTASSVNGSGPWNWTCTSGARSVDCAASHAQTAIQIVKSNGKNNGDSQTIETGADASFTITVTNTGEETLADVVVSDDEARGCARSASQTESLYDGALFDAGESFSYTCTDTNVTNSYTNIAGVVANATTSDITVEDDDASNVVVSDPEEEPVTPKKDPVTPDPTPEEPEEEDEDEDDDGAIGNFVWHDRNKNGVQDPGEEGIAGVKIKLYNGNDKETDRTNSRGRYKFKGLDSGQYRVIVAEETLPAGCYQTFDKDGKLDNKTKVRIDGDEYYRKADFGYYCPSSAPVAHTSPKTGAGATAGAVSFITAALAAGFVQRRNTKK